MNASNHHLKEYMNHRPKDDLIKPSDVSYRTLFERAQIGIVINFPIYLILMNE